MEFDSLDEKILFYENEFLKEEGKLPKYNLSNRLRGFLKAGVGIGAYFVFDKNPLVFLYSPFFVDGVADFFSGRKETFHSKFFKTNSKYKLNRLKERRFEYNFSKGIDFES